MCLDERDNFEQCEKCGIPKYRHPYYEDCEHDFFRILEEDLKDE